MRAPSVAVSGAPGRSGSFEVLIDGRFKAYSKLATGRFPDYSALAADIAAYSQSGSPSPAWQPLS